LNKHERRTAVIKKFLTLSFVFGVLLVGTAVAKEKPLKVFVFGGQSNMVGYGASVGELPPALQGELPNVVVFDGAKWVPLVASKTTGGKPGPEVSCAQKLSAELKEPIGVIKFAVSGSSLAGDWAIANPGSLYGRLVKTVKAAHQSREIEIVGMFWLQGERDARIDAAEERAHLAGPRHGGELVHRGNHKAGQPAVDRLIDGQNR
jgi:hypothetical protein